MIGKHEPKPGERTAQTFTRHYMAQDENGLALRKPAQIAKDKMATVMPVQTNRGTAFQDAVSATESSEAL